MILIFPLSLSFQHLYRPIINLYTLNVFYANENDILLHFFPHAYYVLNFNITSPLQVDISHAAVTLLGAGAQCPYFSKCPLLNFSFR